MYLYHIKVAKGVSVSYHVNHVIVDILLMLRSVVLFFHPHVKLAMEYICLLVQDFLVPKTYTTTSYLWNKP